MKALAYGAAVAAIGLDSLFTGGPTPFLPFGSSVSLLAAGLILIFWEDLSALAARLSALICGAWAILLKAPSLLAALADGSAWVGCFGLLALAIIGLTLAGELEGWEKKRGAAKGRAISWLYPPPSSPRPGYQGSRG